MLMHEWIRYRNQQVTRSSDGDVAEPDEPAPQGDELAPEPAADAADAEADRAVADHVADPRAAAEPTEDAGPAAEPELEIVAAEPAQAPTEDAESTDRAREEVIASLQEELERAGQSIRERVQQLQARQKQLPIDVEDASDKRDGDRPRQASETRQDLVQRLLDPTLMLREAALLLDVCPTTVRRYTNRGLLNCFRTPGNQRRFHLSDVLDFMERRERGEV